jgi:hypothetical protein
MKGITLTQPWATLVAIGAKKIETRSWSTKYRGPLAIHAARNFPNDDQCLCFREPFRKILIGEYGFIAGGEIYLGNHKFPLGCVIATCELVHCFLIHKFQYSFCPEDHSKWVITPEENAFGDFTPGRFAWILEDIKPLEKPIQAKGRLGLWEWDESEGR